MVEYAGNLYFGFAYEVVFAVFCNYVGNVGGICFAEYASGKIFEISLFVTRLYGIGVPCIVHYEIDRDFFRFQIAYIYNPDAVDAGTVGKVELLPEFWNCGGIYPSVIPRASVHVDVVVHSKPPLRLRSLSVPILRMYPQLLSQKSRVTSSGTVNPAS